MHTKDGSQARAALEAVQQLRAEWVGLFKRCGDAHKATRHAWKSLREAQRVYFRLRRETAQREVAHNGTR